MSEHGFGRKLGKSFNKLMGCHWVGIQETAGLRRCWEYMRVRAYGVGKFITLCRPLLSAELSADSRGLHVCMFIYILYFIIFYYYFLFLYYLLYFSVFASTFPFMCLCCTKCTIL